MRYCGVVAAQGLLQLAMLEEVRTRSRRSACARASTSRARPSRWRRSCARSDDVVVARGGPLGPPRRARGRALRRRSCRSRGVPPRRPRPRDVAGWSELLAGLVPSRPAGGRPGGRRARGRLRGDAACSRRTPTASSARCTGRRLPAQAAPARHAAADRGAARRARQDDGGDLWHRRIEEIDAVAAALAAHRFAVGHACWVGDPAEGVIVLPGLARCRSASRARASSRR